MSDPPSSDEGEPTGLQAQLSSLMSGLHENAERLRQCREDYETKMAACAEQKVEKDGIVEEMRAGLQNLISARTEETTHSAPRQTTAGSHSLREGQATARAVHALCTDHAPDQAQPGQTCRTNCARTTSTSLMRSGCSQKVGTPPCGGCIVTPELSDRSPHCRLLESRHSRERSHAELLHALRDRRSTPSQ